MAVASSRKGIGIGIGIGVFSAIVAVVVAMQPSSASDARSFLDLAAENGRPLTLVVLADTSTSMSDAQRARQENFLHALVSALQPDDRLALMALDAETKWLSEGFVSAQETERLATALERLSRRLSLGWTDIPAAVQKALDLVADDARHRADEPVREVDWGGGEETRLGEEPGKEVEGDKVGWHARLATWFKTKFAPRGVAHEDEVEGLVFDALPARFPPPAYHIVYIGDGLHATTDIHPQRVAQRIEAMFEPVRKTSADGRPLRLVGHTMLTVQGGDRTLVEAFVGANGVCLVVEPGDGASGPKACAEIFPEVVKASPLLEDPRADGGDEASTGRHPRRAASQTSSDEKVDSLPASGGQLLSFYDAINAIRQIPEDRFAICLRWAKRLADGEVVDRAGVGFNSSVLAGDEVFLAQALLAVANEGLTVSERVVLLEILQPVYHRAPVGMRMEREWTQRMATLRRAQGKDERALETVEALARTFPWDAQIYCDYGEALALAGRIDEAKAWFDRGAATPERFWRHGGRDAIRQAHVEFLERHVAPEKALPAIAERLAETPDSESDHRRLIRLMVRAGRKDEAAAMVAQWLALASSPGAPTASEVAKITAAVELVAGDQAPLSPRGVRDEWLMPLAAVVVAAGHHEALLPPADTVARQPHVRQSPPLQAALKTVAIHFSATKPARSTNHAESLSAWLEESMPAHERPTGMADFAPAEAVSTAPVAFPSPPTEDALRDMRGSLRQAPSGTRRRLAAARHYADALWHAGRRDVAAEVLVREVSDYQQAQGGVATVGEYDALVRVVDFLVETERFNWAERIVNANFARAETVAYAESLRRLLYRLYAKALVAGGETDLGRDDALYREVLQRIHRQIADLSARPEHWSGDDLTATMSAVADFLQAADEAKMPTLARDVRTLAIDVLPSLLASLDEATTYDALARQATHSLVRPHLGDRGAIGFAIAATKSRPWHLPLVQPNGLLDDVAAWRKNVDPLGPLDAPLQALASEALAEALLYGVGGIPALCGGDPAAAAGHSPNLLWREKADDFAQVAERCHRARREWLGVNTRAARYLARSLERPERALDMLLELAAENRLDRKGQIELTGKLVAHRRYNEALAAFAKLPPEALLDEQVADVALAAFAANDAMRDMVDAVQAGYEARLRDHPRDVAGLRSLIDFLDRRGASRQAYQRSYQLTRAKPLDLAAYEDFFKRSLALAEDGSQERTLTAVVDAMPFHADAHAMVARWRERQRRWADAVAHWRQVASLDAANPTGLLRQAKAQARGGDVAGGLATIHLILAREWHAEYGDVHGQALDLLSPAGN